MDQINNMDANQLYAEVEKMLYKLAWQTSKTYGIPFEVCRSECDYAFVKALNWRYDPSKGTKFSTCVHTIARWRLKNLVRGRMEEAPTIEIEEGLLGAAPPTRAESLELIDDLSHDAKEILSLLLETPKEILGQAPIPVHHLVKRVKDYLVQQGRAKRDVDRAHKELQTRFKEAWT